MNRESNLEILECEENPDHFSMEAYFIWFSALIFFTELITDFSLVTYYLHQSEYQWGLITFSIIMFSLILCQICSIFMIRNQKNFGILQCCLHAMLLAIPHKYHRILRRVDREKMSNQDLENIKRMITEINILQVVNAFFQYLPQFLFQAYLIVYKKYKCVITGVSAGLAGFSFLWYISICLFYLSKHCLNSNTRNNSTIRAMDNITYQLDPNRVRLQNSCKGLERSDISENLKIFEKKTYKTDDKNLASKKKTLKNVEKNKIFGTNKRKAVYEANDFDLYDYNNMSTEFFEINESQDNSNSIQTVNKCDKTEEFNNENNTNLSLIGKDSFDKVNELTTNTTNEIRVSKRKGICSSQEMLNLVDIMNDIPPEQVDILARSLVEMGGEESLKTESDGADNSKLLEQFPEYIDDKLMENIETAIYENQVIFQERIRKNQLTIQNLMLQDQLLSKYIEEVKNLPSNAMIDIRDYENMCFANVNRQNRLKHWRNYLQDIDTNIHDNSTIQNSSFYVNTMSNSLTDLYVNETEIASVTTDDGKINDQICIQSINTNKKSVHWPEKLTDEDINSSLYINVVGTNTNLPCKNLLVETINAINVHSPISQIVNKKAILPHSITED